MTRRSYHTRYKNTVVLPYLPDGVGSTEHDIFVAFISALREGPKRRMEVRILTAIHRAADISDNSDAYVSRVLVDMGLLAPRLAFPGDFLDHVDATLVRKHPLGGKANASYYALVEHWVDIGDEVHTYVAHKIDPVFANIPSFLEMAGS